MAQELSGAFSGKGKKIALAVARFNSAIVERLVDGALDALRRSGVAEDDIVVARVPGAWETPLLCQKMAQSGKFDAVIACGCVIQGDTPHFDYVAGENAKGLNNVALQTGVPVINCVLTTHTVDQAMDRAGIKHGNKGFDAAMAALETIDVLGQV